MNLETQEERSNFLRELEQALVAELERRNIPYLKTATRVESYGTAKAFDLDIIPFQGSVHNYFVFTSWTSVKEQLLSGGLDVKSIAVQYATSYLSDMLETNELWFKRGEQTDNLRAFQARLEQVRE